MVTCAVCVFDPHRAMRVYVVVAAGEMLWEPGVAIPPIPWSISAESALVTAPHCNVVDWPLTIVVAAAPKLAMPGAPLQLACATAVGGTGVGGSAVGGTGVGATSVAGTGVGGMVVGVAVGRSGADVDVEVGNDCWMTSAVILALSALGALVGPPAGARVVVVVQAKMRLHIKAMAKSVVLFMVLLCKCGDLSRAVSQNVDKI